MDADALTSKLTLAAQEREVTPLEEDWINDCKRGAYECYDLLLEMGGRPTRTVLEEPAWKAIYEQEEIRIVDDRGELQKTVALDENLALHHWKGEYFRFEEELNRWKEFRDYQQGMEHKPLLKTNSDPETTNQRLIKILVRLNDWREFQYCQQVKVGRALMLIWNTTRNMKNIMSKEVASNEPDSSPEIQSDLATCFQQLFPRQTGFEISEMQLSWIESQILEILMEAYASLVDNFPLQQQLEMKLEQQANVLNQELKNLEARPDCLIHSPHQSAGLAQRICHWGSEITRLMGEHWEWKIFLKWRNNKPSTQTAANVGERETSGCLSDLQIWVDYVSYRRFQLDRTRTWVAGWQRLQRLRENDLVTTSKDQGFFLLKDTISSIRAYVQKFQQDVRTAELQVQSAEQQLAELSSQQFSPATVQITPQSSGHPHSAPSPPDSESIERIPGTPNLTDLSSSPIRVYRTRRWSKSPLSEIPVSIQQSNAPNRENGTQRKGTDLNEEQLFTVTDIVVSEQVMVDNDIQMIDAPDYSFLDEEIGDGGGAELETSVIDVEDTDNSRSRISSNFHSRTRGTRISRKSPNQVPISRQTRSAKMLDQIVSSRVLKVTGKKAAKKVKPFTEQQDTVLQSTALVNGSSTDSPPLRRSQRLKEKAAAPCRFTSAQVNVAEPSKASRFKRSGEQPSSVKSSHLPRQKKPMVQPSALNLTGKSRQRKPKIPTDAIEPPKLSRRKRLKT